MSNETKQTAVDQIVNLLNKEGFTPVLTEEEIKFFKEMEKEQIISDNIAGMEFIPVDPNRYQEDAEDYYNETYGGNK